MALTDGVLEAEGCGRETRWPAGVEAEDDESGQDAEGQDAAGDGEGGVGAGDVVVLGEEEGSWLSVE